MRRLVATVLVTLAVSTLLTITSPAHAHAATLSTAPARAEIARLVAGAYPGLAVGNVACPPTATRAAGTTFTCTVQIPGAFLVVDATQDDRTGAVTLTTPHAVLSKQSLEQFVAANASLGAIVDCGPAPMIVRRPGQTVTCAAALEDGTRRTVTLSVRDTAGTVAIVAVG
ncbi:MAG: DUF4333 domain-containing protein [Acidimicrobiia bacterium]